jgi:hypothetical protein
MHLFQVLQADFVTTETADPDYAKTSFLPAVQHLDHRGRFYEPWRVLQAGSAHTDIASKDRLLERIAVTVHPVEPHSQPDKMAGIVTAGPGITS